MTIRKTKSGKWTVDVSNGFHPVTQKRIRIIRKGLKSKGSPRARTTYSSCRIERKTI